MSRSAATALRTGAVFDRMKVEHAEQAGAVPAFRSGVHG
jgi:hypothetical protein